MISHSRKNLIKPSPTKPKEDISDEDRVPNPIDQIQAQVNLDQSKMDKLSSNENKHANDFNIKSKHIYDDKSNNQTPQSSQLNIAHKITRHTAGADGTGFYNAHNNNNKRQTSKKQSAIKNYAEVANSLLPSNNIQYNNK